MRGLTTHVTRVARGMRGLSAFPDGIRVEVTEVLGPGRVRVKRPGWSGTAVVRVVPMGGHVPEGSRPVMWFEQGRRQLPFIRGRLLGRRFLAQKFNTAYDPGPGWETWRRGTYGYAGQWTFDPSTLSEVAAASEVFFLRGYGDRIYYYQSGNLTTEDVNTAAKATYAIPNLIAVALDGDNDRLVTLVELGPDSALDLDHTYTREEGEQDGYSDGFDVGDQNGADAGAAAGLADVLADPSPGNYRNSYDDTPASITCPGPPTSRNAEYDAGYCDTENGYIAGHDEAWIQAYENAYDQAWNENGGG